MHVTTDDHGEWRVNTMTEDGDISTTGTFYVTVAKEPTAIREGFIKRSGQIGEKGAFQFRIYRFISHFFLLKTLYGAHMSNEKKSPFLGGDGHNVHGSPNFLCFLWVATWKYILSKRPNYILLVSCVLRGVY